MPQGRKFWQDPLFWLTLCGLLSLLIVAYPIYVIRPFRYQGSLELEMALALIRIRPVFEIALVAVALTLAVHVWRDSASLWRKTTACVCALSVVLFGWLSEINIYELMFHPLDKPAFSPVSTAKLDGREEVIAIRIGKVARAYPVRSMSYHHIVNDVVGGVPIVATY